ncbi:C40 family peptidase [Allobranchiibius sp. GilTou73]|uniref:C40 family peptidase n=1 Tax=Allobranchiibius sp. GilTou73 TaxID=2904523 RepID=UPI001F387A67|nr:NlpC/P60 family protein [Allobranchiibius sp. GilTou73]UIJ34520.1 NlpC/P60 family protein [Allobranchiibius sp. GilTou73]
MKEDRLHPGVTTRPRILTVLLGLLLTSVAMLSLGWSTPAHAADGCTAGHNASGQSVYYCGVWVPSGGIPVYSSTSQGSSVIDHLHSGGTANWFYCSTSGGTATASGYKSTSWARSVGDDNGAIGYVPAVYFSGSENYWAGLPSCSGGTGSSGSSCHSGTNKSGTTVSYCGIWTPSGGTPIYASTSSGSGVVDHLNTAGTGNWFFCEQKGSSITVGGYTSSDWAKTIGDDHGATGYVPAVYFTGSQNYWAGMPACSTPAPPPSDDSCTLGHNPSGGTAYYCPVWVPSGGVPLYGSTSTSSGVVDHLHTGGSANWFYCRVNGSTATVGGYSSSSWAKTIGDDHGATGYVPAVYFTGSQDYWVNLPSCGSGSTNPTPPSPPSNGGANTNGSACGTAYTGLPGLTLKMMQQACRVTVTSDSMYKYSIYAWDGGHGSTPGPTYGSCDPSNGAPNDCHVDGFDCSGLVRWAYYQATGVDALDGYTWGQWSKALALPHKAVINAASHGGSGQVDNYLSQLKPGDILWYGQNAGEHVAIYMGNGKQMNAYQSGDHDGITSVTTGDTFWGAVRMW